MMYRTALSLLLTLTVIACGSDSSDSVSLDKPVNGKSDAADEMCESLGLQAGCELCREAGWYGDGACDTFCAAPDPDCASFAPHQCGFDTVSVVSDLESSGELRDLAVGDATEYTEEDAAEIGVLRAKQIVATAILTLFLDADADLADAFNGADDQTIWHQEISHDRQALDWIRMWAGDTQVGGVFLAGTLELVAEISDGDVVPCVAEVAAPITVACDFDTASPLGDSSGPLEEDALSSTRYSTADIDAIPSIVARQIVAAAVHLESVQAGQDLAAAVESADDGAVFFLEIEAKGSRYDWIQFFLGDTEVGAVFEQATTNQVAEISDGEILGCVPQ